MDQSCLVLKSGLIVTHPQANALGHAGLMALLNQHAVDFSDVAGAGFLSEQHQVVDQLYHLADSAEVERYVNELFASQVKVDGPADREGQDSESQHKLDAG